MKWIKFPDNWFDKSYPFPEQIGDEEPKLILVWDGHDYYSSRVYRNKWTLPDWNPALCRDCMNELDKIKIKISN